MSAGWWFLHALAFIGCAVLIERCLTLRALKKSEHSEKIADDFSGWQTDAKTNSPMILGEPQYTRWFAIGIDGQPGLPGWWDVIYEGYVLGGIYRRYWTGLEWLESPTGHRTGFGMPDFPGDCYRGLAQDPNAIVNLDRNAIENLRFQLRSDNGSAA